MTQLQLRLMTISTDTNVISLTVDQARAWNDVWGRMPAGGTYGVPKADMQRDYGQPGDAPTWRCSLDFEEVLRALEGFANGLERHFDDHEDRVRRLQTLEMQQRAMRSFLGIEVTS